MFSKSKEGEGSGEHDPEKHDAFEDSNPEDSHVENIRQSQVHYEIDPALSKRLDRKFDIHIIPWLFGIWLFAFIDRSNIGNAKIDGLLEDLDMVTGTKFNVALNWIVKKIRAGVYLPTLITCWGIVSTFLGFTKSFAGLVVYRLLLGLFEGGLLGGIVVYLAMFYRRHQMLYRIGLFYCAAPLSGAFGGLLATGLATIRRGGYNRWPWIFFVEGAITTVFGVTCFFFMPSTPADAKFLTTDEHVNDEHFSWHWVKMAVLAPQTCFCTLAWIFLLIPLYSFSLFLPSIIQGLGYRNTTQIQLLTVPPNIAAFLVVLATSALSDKIKARGPIMAVGSMVALCGYTMILASKSSNVRYGGTFLIATGVFPGIGLLIGLANTSAFPATFIYLQKDAPDYVLGHSVCVDSLVLCCVKMCLQMLYCRWENSKRERGDRDERLRGNKVHLLGHRHPAYRYTL
ncbi:major facilitator superfamily domain-containing protein [Colletotrichum phormii]|uniref:Major facilitator superfamily domain-containing protein n=1 Tax=Colletotrichum phormii TaxID=359342 RepID=A0AAI9ZIN1_9PEZI|nr:major facilitator superfamily domain-containing protein [Colletotrichum phormii]KAK1625166.1 major facilitator superfamily domain-containing protein [Colletotrichum phormii]